MAKSKYPDKLDTSIEIPAVRDNIIEVGSDVLNSLRSAIFQIEKTLGVNPQGAVGNTVSDRINKALDGNGNILKEALDRSSVLSGPIVNNDVSKTAAINENKLRLDYPTQLLQDEISQLMKQLDIALVTLEELSVLLGAHVHPAATNRHLGQAITIGKIDNTSSSEGITSLDVTTSQGAFESIFQSHINYDGSDISSGNRSHKALQLYFDNEDVSSYIDSQDVQGAIEDILEYATGQLSEHQNHQHDNGILKTTTITSATDLEEGLLLLDDQDVSYSATVFDNTRQSVIVRFNAPPDVPDIGIVKSDILKITDSAGSINYQIDKVNYSLDGSTIETVEVFGTFLESSESGAQGKIYQNINREANFAGLLVTAREYQSISGISYSNADILQIANPNAATIITQNINPSEISLTNRYFKLSVDGEDAIELDVLEGSVSKQTVDTIIMNLNAQFSENASNASAYRLDYEEGRSSQIALVHSLPSDSSNSRTLTVSRGSDDALDSLGLASFEDSVIDAGIGTQYYIQGKAYNGIDTKFSETGLVLLSGTSSITSTKVDFEEAGLRKGDLIIVAESDSDDGTYVILDVASSSLTVDENQLSGGEWSGESTPDTEFYVYKNSISLETMEFDVASAGGSNGAIIDLFMDYDRNIFYDVRLEYGIKTFGPSDSIISIIDFDGDTSVYLEDAGLEGQLDAELSVAGNAVLSLDGGAELELTGTKQGHIELVSGKYDIKLTIYIEDSDLIVSELASGNFTMLLYGDEGINREENMLLARVLYESGSSRIAGAGADFPRVFSRMRRGTVGYKDLGSDAIYATHQRPHEETRSNGVIRGLDLSVADIPIETINNQYVINLTAGVCYVKGKRFELDLKEDLITGVSSGDDKFFVAVDEWGGLVFAPADSVTCSCPFDAFSYCILGSVEYDGSNNPVPIDLRLFIDNLDLTVLNSITVSPQKGMGHFSDLGKALKYAKRFSSMFPKAGVPTVHLKSGTHKIINHYPDLTAGAFPGILAQIQGASDDGNWINFPVNITGEGYSTVIDIMKTFSDAGEADDDRTSSSNTNHDGFLFIAGPGLTSVPAGNADVLEEGFVNLSNFRMRLCPIWILDPVVEDVSGNKLNWGVNIDNVIFDQSEKEDWGAFNRGIKLDQEDSDASGTIFGNLKVTNCQFLNSHISTALVGSGTIDYKNINISNNTFRGSGDGAIDGEDHYAVYLSDSSNNLFSFTDNPAENDIEFRANTIADNQGAAAYLTSNGTFEWGDRISRKLYVSSLSSGSSSGGPLHLVDGPLHLVDGTDANPAVLDSGFLIIGDTSSPHIKIDNNEIMCVNDTTGTTLFIQKDTGDFGKTEIRGGTDADVGSHSGHLIIGTDGSSGGHLVMDGNEIMAKADAETAEMLYLQKQGDKPVVIAGGDDVEHNAAYSGRLVLLNMDSNTSLHLDENEIMARDGGSNSYANLHLQHAGGDLKLWAKSGADPGCLVLGNGGTTQFADGDIFLKFDLDRLFQWKMEQAGSATQITFESEDPGKIYNIRNFTDVRFYGDGGNVDTSGNDHILLDLRENEIHIGGNDNDTQGGIRFEIFDASEYWKVNTRSGDHTLRFMSVSSTGTKTTMCYLKHLGQGGVAIGSLNFTGQHRSMPKDKNTDMYADHIGEIVISSGEYLNFSEDEESFKPNISQSLPTVILSSERMQKSIFGVISEVEDDSEERTYNIGALNFVAGKKGPEDKRLFINSVGEGAIWVCNINGDLENGDYITSCEAPGLGMKQDDDFLHNYTAAKITQDCDFNLNSNNYDCVEFEFNGQTYKKAFVGCTYHCG